MKVYIGIPNQGKIHPALHAMLQAVGRKSILEKRLEIFQRLHNEKPVEHTRNMFVEEAIKRGDDVLWMIDDDTVPAIETERSMELLFKLIEADHAIVALPTPMWRNDRFAWNCMNWEQDHDAYIECPHTDGLHPCDLAGTGSMLLARRVLEDERIKPLFEREWYPDGTQKWSSDFVFCRKARAKGWPVIASWNHPCHHYKQADYLQCMKLQKLEDRYGIRLQERQFGSAVA